MAKKKGLSMGFASRQKSTLDGSSNRLDSKLAELQKNQEALEAERQQLEELREQLEAREPSISPVRLLALSELHLSGDAQSRVFVNPTVVSEYTERMRFDDELELVIDPEGTPWSPVRVYEDEHAEPGAPRYWVADGFHRVSAAEALDITQIQCEVLPGSPRDAIRESLSANARHGLRRTREDKRRAVQRALKDDEWRTWTDQRVADMCAVSRALVSSIRQDLERARTIPFEIALYGADGREFEREEPEEEFFVTSEQIAELVQGKVDKIKKNKDKTPKDDASNPIIQASWRGLNKALNALDAPSTLIAYPTSKVHYESLVTMLPDAPLVQRVLCPVMSGTDWLWRGPALLDALTKKGFAQPVLLTVLSLDKQFICWTRPEHGYSSDRLCHQAVVGDSGLLVGKPLDSWEG